MPAVMLDTWRPSECPIHGPVHAIWLDGHYGRWSAFHERTRYTCVRYDAAGKRVTHRFTPPLATRNATEYAVPGSDPPEGVSLDGPTPDGGTQTSTGSTFTVAEIARLLISVGEGRPLRDCAHDLRAEAGRRHCPPSARRARAKLEAGPVRPASATASVPLLEMSTRPLRPPKKAARPPGSPSPRDDYNYSAPKLLRRVDPSRSASTAMDYVDQYGPVVLDGIAPEHWPAYVAIGAVAVPARIRHGANGNPGLVSGGEVMLAADCEIPGHGYTFHARFGGGRDKDSWIDFLRSLTGAPDWIVTAADDGLSQAVAEFWPDTTLFVCEEHLRSELRQAARADLVQERRPEHGPIFDEIRGALKDVAHWQELAAVTETLAPSRSAHLRRWIDDNEALVLSQLLLKKRNRNAPTDARSLEPARADIRAKLLQRAGLIRNLWRLNLRLALMAAHWSELDRERDYVADLERHFSAPAGPARVRRKSVRPDWASGRDYGGARSIDEFLAAADARRRAAEVGDDGRLIVAAGQPDFNARNAARASVGLPPIPMVPVVDLGAGTPCVAAHPEDRYIIRSPRIGGAPRSAKIEAARPARARTHAAESPVGSLQRLRKADQVRPERPVRSASRAGD